MPQAVGGAVSAQRPTQRSPTAPVLMIKIQALQVLYSLSDGTAELQIKGRPSLGRLRGQGLDVIVRDATTYGCSASAWCRQR